MSKVDLSLIAIPEVLKHNNVISSDNLTKANMFNKYFFEQFSSSSTYDVDIDFSTDDLFNIDFNCSRIKDLLDNINVNKASGPDGIHGRVLKNCSMSLCRPLSILFKLIYNTGIIPLEWKSANIVPVHKKGGNAQVSNYRPISLICLSAKIMECIIQQELLDRCREKLSPIQHGFLPNRSCTTNLINLKDDIALNLYRDIGADIIYFDFAKAFDTVNHDLLIHKLKKNFNIDGRLLKFVTSYLKDRRQCVVMENVFSDYEHVLSGVPQGSILGPLLFTLFINDINDGISTETNICLYADDTKIWRPMKTELDCAILQKDVECLNEWCKSNKMRFNPEKCKVVSVVSNPNNVSLLNLLPFSQFSYALGNSILDYENCEKDLGVIVNGNFAWSEQHLSIISKASQMLGLTKRTCHFRVKSRTKRTLYLTLVRSQFEHCSLIWRPLTQSKLVKFEAIQKNAIKWILNEEFVSYSDNDVYFGKCNEVNILPVSKTFDLNDLMFFHKIVNGQIPTKLPSYITKYNGISRLRNNHLDHECYVCNLEYSNNAKTKSPLLAGYFYRVIHTWNKLPLVTRQTPCENEFKNLVKKFFWDEILET